MTDPSADTGTPSIRKLALLAVPAVMIGIVAALMLFGLIWVSDQLESYLWKALPSTLGIDPNNGWWIFSLLTLSGIAVGLIVWLVPGHGGSDSATTELIAPPLRIAALPSLILVTVLGLAGGVSLGPENPILAINVSLILIVIARLLPKVPTQLVILMVVAGTVGALFNTPVAAALILTGMVAAAKTGGALWDRLFLPLASAGAGALTMSMLGGSSLSVDVPMMGGIQPIFFAEGLVIAVLSTGLGLAIVYSFPYVHQVFHGLKYPIIYISLGGVVLGVLGVIGGPLTLFKGLAQMSTLVDDQQNYDFWQLTLMTLVKCAALVVAAAAGFRGGRIFPAVFIGVAFGLMAHSLFPGIPISLAIASGVLGIVLAIARDGWIALFIAVAVVGDITVLSILCIIILPIWLMVSRAPEMLITPKELEAEERGWRPRRKATPEGSET